LRQALDTGRGPGAGCLDTGWCRDNAPLTLRALLAMAAAVLVALVATAPHHHASSQGAQECVACLTRTAEEAQGAVPDLAPRAGAVEAVPAEPGLPPVTGAPLGATPGQSPPRA